MQLNYLPIPKSHIDKIRNTGYDDFGHKIELSIAGKTGYGPCRFCLKQFSPGEKRLLFSYAPVQAVHAYNEVGPVYVHEHCTAYDQPNTFPEEVKNGRLPIHLVLRCYNKDKRMIYACFIKENSEVEENINRLFADPQVEFIHIRNATYQCYIAEVRIQGTGS